MSTGLLAGCVTEDAGDGRDDEFPSGKGDGAIEEGSWQARSVLRVANTVSYEVLSRSVANDGVGLTRTAARGIITFREGVDGELGTSDDRQFSELWLLDAVPYIGPVSFTRMLDYAVAHGLATSNEFECEPESPSPSAVFYKGTWQGGEWDLTMRAIHPDWESWEDCAATYGQATPGVTRYVCYIEPEWTFHVPVYAVKLPTDASSRTGAFTATVVEVTPDRRFNDGVRELPDTARSYNCKPAAPPMP